MKGLRPLLRLDDKVAAEGRRLQNLGAGTSRWGGLTLLAAAAILHGAMLTLPAVHVTPTFPAASPAPNFPRVWRFDPPSAPAPTPTPTPTPTPLAQTPAHPAGQAREVTLPPESDQQLSRPPVVLRPLSTEPVPEPAPDISIRLRASQVEANIPYPDAPPPPIEPAPPVASVARSDESVPRLVTRFHPVYPVAARSVGAEGQVRLRVSVLPDGSVERASVVDCSRPGVGFEAAAVDAVKRWRYEPAPQATTQRSVTVTVQFKTEGGRP